jgi:hypothetical protein
LKKQADYDNMTGLGGDEVDAEFVGKWGVC